MCYDCRPDRYNPNCFDPLREGEQMQKMEPQVERLVIQAEKVGYLTADNRNVKRILSERDEELNQTVGELAETQRKLNYVKDDLRQVVKERDTALRKVPKKPKKVTKKGKK